jgi:hypothetical protein
MYVVHYIKINKKRVVSCHQTFNYGGCYLLLTIHAGRICVMLGRRILCTVVNAATHARVPFSQYCKEAEFMNVQFVIEVSGHYLESSQT